MSQKEIVAGRFAILGPVGEGGGGEVFKAVDLDEGGRQVAVKFVHGHPDDPTTKLFFERETLTLSRLDHPNIVRMLDAGWHPDRNQYYLALEWANGGTLLSAIERREWSDWDTFAERYAVPLSNALSYAHLENVEHRDIKPANILIDDGLPKLADFGIAKLRDRAEPLGQTLVAWSTAPYAPPEGVKFGYEKTRDVWALAVVFIQAMTQVWLETIGDVFEQLPDIPVPNEIRALLARCIDLDPAARPANASVFCRDLEEIQFARRAARIRKAAALWLDLSRRAIDQLTPEGQQPDLRKSQQIAADDLVEHCRVEYRFDHEAAQLDRETVFLYGATWRFVLKEVAESYAFKVVGASKQADPTAVRKRTCSVRDVLEISFWNPGRAFAEGGADQLRRSLEDHHDRRNMERELRAEHAAENTLFDRYLSLLDAREELARGDRQPLRYTSCSRGRREVTFQLATPLEQEILGEEWDVRIAPGKPLARGEVVAQTAETVVLRFRREMRSLPESGELSPYLGPTQRAHERQVEAVRRIRDGHCLRPDLRQFIIDPASIRAPLPKEPASWVSGDLDQSKRDAVSALLGAEDFLIVEGPPGTGKTTFITEAVEQVLRRRTDAKVLIVSQTHVAVDNALEKLDEAGMSGLVRLGRPADPRVAESVRHLLLDERMDDWSRRLRLKAEGHMAKVASAYGVPLGHLHAAIALERLAAVLADAEIVRSRSSSSEIYRGAATSTGVERLRDRVEIQERLDALSDQRDDLLNEINAHLAGDFDIPTDIDRDDARAAAAALLGNSGVPRSVLELVQLQGEWLQRVASDRKLVESFLATTSVLAGTCIGFLGHPAVRDLEFDLCILDEASKAAATEAMVPLARARRWVLVGDTQQLPPLEEELLRKKQLLTQYDLDEEFVRTTLFDRLVAITQPPVRHLLREQYRMVPAIGNLISTVFYRQELVSMRNDAIPGLDLLGKPVVWLDTGPLGTDRFEDRAESTTRSRINRHEARLVIRRLGTVDKAVGRGVIRPPNGRRLSVLLISPYRLQNQELEKRLAGAKIENLAVEVQSVDAVQGREADIAIFSVTRSNDYADLGFLAEPYRRRINVALSRARFSLTIVGDMKFCMSQSGGLRDVALYVREHPSECETAEADRA